MIRTLLNASSYATTRILAWRFTKPLARTSMAALGLLFLAFVGWHAVPGALAGGTPSAMTTASVAPEPSHEPSPPPPPIVTISAAPSTPIQEPGVASRARASPNEPVVLNTATPEDLRRLPGIGQKRANAIADLRSRIGRFHAIEDLLKVKGIGRAMLKRLRPLVRLDPVPGDVDR
jgi:competence protein ComEA